MVSRSLPIVATDRGPTSSRCPGPRSTVEDSSYALGEDAEALLVGAAADRQSPPGLRVGNPCWRWAPPTAPGILVAALHWAAALFVPRWTCHLAVGSEHPAHSGWRRVHLDLPVAPTRSLEASKITPAADCS